MTENEIIKALKCCGDESHCVECPFKNARFGYDVSCAEELMKTAAETIKNLTAENERLKTMHSEMCIGMKTLKKKAYKEFAEILKKETIFISDSIDRSTMLIVIDALLEELPGHKETSVSLIDGHIEGSDD